MQIRNAFAKLPEHALKRVEAFSSGVVVAGLRAYEADDELRACRNLRRCEGLR